MQLARENITWVDGAGGVLAKLAGSGGIMHRDMRVRTLEWATIRALDRHVKVSKVVLMRRSGDTRRRVSDEAFGFL